MSAAAVVNLASPEGELAALKGELTAAKAELNYWSGLVKQAPIGSEERKEAKEREAIYLSRVTALEAIYLSREGQIAGKYYSFLNKHQRTNRSHH